MISSAAWTKYLTGRIHTNAIINTQVLEHVEYPQKVLDEFYRILAPGGKLFLTAPQG